MNSVLRLLDARFRGQDSRRLWRLLQRHSGLMPAPLITLAHFTVWAITKALASAGVNTIGIAPTSANRARIVGSASAALISRLSRSMISRGVPVGVPTPENVLTSKPGMVSSASGMLGTAGDRFAGSRASARTEP